VLNYFVQTQIIKILKALPLAPLLTHGGGFLFYMTDIDTLDIKKLLDEHDATAEDKLDAILFLMQPLIENVLIIQKDIKILKSVLLKGGSESGS